MSFESGLQESRSSSGFSQVGKLCIVFESCYRRIPFLNAECGSELHCTSGAMASITGGYQLSKKLLVRSDSFKLCLLVITKTLRC